MALSVNSDYSIPDNWLNLPILNEHQLSNLPPWLLQPPSQSPSGTTITSTTTGSVHHPPQRMNVDDHDHIENIESNHNNDNNDNNDNIEPSPSVQILSVPPSNNNNNKTSRSKPIIPRNMNMHNRNSDNSFSWNTNTNVINTNLNTSSSNSNCNLNPNPNPNPTQTLSSIINGGISNNNLNLRSNNNRNNQHNNQHSINMDTSVPISTDCEDLARMLHELNGQLQLQTGKGLTRQQTQHYTEMFVNMSKDLDHPYCLRLLPLLLAIKDLFKSQEIDALNTTKCLHKICLKYESLGQRQ